MNEDTRTILRRWQAIEDGRGVGKAKALARALSLLALALFIVVAIGIAYGLHPGAIAIASLAVGWLIAETNALRSRLTQWPIFKQYIDWGQVQRDLNGDDNTDKKDDKLQPIVGGDRVNPPPQR